MNKEIRKTKLLVPEGGVIVDMVVGETIISDGVERQAEETLAVQDYVPHIAIVILYRK